MNKPLLIGVGQSWRNDDGQGPLVIAELKNQLSSSFDFLVVEGDPLELLDHWEGRSTVVVIDTYDDEEASGEIRHWSVSGKSSGSVTDLPFVTGGFSSHLFGLAETIRLGEALGRNPRELHLIGIPGRNFGLKKARPPRKELLAAVVKRVIEVVEMSSRRIACMNPE